MKEDAILGPFDINQIEDFVRAGLILKRDYAYDIEYPDCFRTVEFFMKQNGKTPIVEHKGNVFSQIKEIGQELTRVRDKDCVKNRVKRAKIVRFTLC